MSPVDIVIAENAGFCWGVERALRMARTAAAEAARPVRSLGPLIHNPGVIAELEREGVCVVDEVADVTEGTVIIRSHGVTREVGSTLADRPVTVIDATCSFVKAAQEKAARLRVEGYRVVVVGEPQHPEVAGIKSHAGPEAVVVEEPADVPADLAGRRVGVVVQTTQSAERLAAMTAALAPLVRELRVFNTICDATERRQAAATALAGSVDLVLVVGGRNSGNTTRLAELCASVQPATHHVETAAEIQPGWLEGVRSVGITAGASTPPEQISAVVTRLRELAP